MSKKSGFTLVELIIVIIIIGVLSSLGLTQYAVVLEKSKKAEARTNLGTLRTLQIAYGLESGTGTYANLTTLIGTGLPSSANLTFHYYYSCDNSTGNCTAIRPATGAKSNPPSAYNITLSPTGVTGGEW